MTQEFKELIEIGLNKVFFEDYEGAIIYYNKSIELEPNYAHTYLLRANVRYELKDYYGAILDYTKAIKLDPKSKYPYYLRGKVRKEIGDIEGHDKDMVKYNELQRQYIFNN